MEGDPYLHEHWASIQEDREMWLEDPEKARKWNFLFFQTDLIKIK